MAERTPKGKKEESPEFATQKIDREELMKAEASGGSEFATRKIDADQLESMQAQEAMASSETMKISQDELMKAMDEGKEKPKETPPAANTEVEPETMTESEHPLMEDKPKMDMKTRISGMNTTNVTIIAISAVLLACICAFTLLGFTTIFFLFSN
jgi:hypothetical protein